MIRGEREGLPWAEGRESVDDQQDPEEVLIMWRKHTVSHFCQTVFVENTTHCPIHCINCPDKLWHGQSMTNAVWHRVLSEIKSCNIGYERMVFGMTGEPLLDHDLAEKIMQVHEMFPDRRIWVNSSGMIPTKPLLDMAGKCISQFSFSFCGYDKKSYEENTRTRSFDTVCRNIQDTIHYPGRQFSVVLSFLAIKQHVGHRKDIERLFPGIPILTVSICNRCGHLENFEELLPDSRARRGRCPKVRDDLTIAFDGKILACCWDWGHELPVGDITTHSLHEILEGETRKRLNALMREGRHDEIVTCARCRIGSDDHAGMV